jgi:hypothetical protein
MRFSLFLLLALLMHSELLSQSVTISEDINIRNDAGYDIIGRYKDRILLFRDRDDSYEIQAYDSRLQTTWNREIEDIEHYNSRIVAVFQGKNDYSIIYTFRRKGSHYLRLHKYDPSANLIDTITLKNYGERPFNPPRLETMRSDDRNSFVIYDLGEKDQISVLCFRMDQMKVIWDKTIHVEDDFSEKSLRGMALSNYGDFFMMSEYDNRKIKREQHRLKLLQVNAQLERLVQVPVPDFLIIHSKLIVDNTHHNLVAAGLCAADDRENAEAAYCLRVPFNQPDTNYVLHQIPFDEQLLSVLLGKDITPKNKDISDAEVRHLLLRADGGVVMLVERSYEVYRGGGMTNAGRFGRGDMRAVVDYYFDDMFAIGIDAQGKAIWKTVLNKKQYSQDDDAIFSSFFLMREADKFHLLFNDEIKYDNSCSEYTVTANGAFDRNSLLNTADQNLRIRFREGIQISTAECLIPSEYRNKLKLLLINFDEPNR